MVEQAINGEALKLARERKGLSVRRTAEETASRMATGGAEALRVRLSKIERGEITAADRELLEELARTLGLGSADDLSEPPLWTWVRDGDHPSFLALGMRQLAFTTPEKAYDARDALALASGGAATPMRETALVPIFRGGLEKTVEFNFGEDLTSHQYDAAIAVDPSAEQMRALWGLQVLFDAQDPQLREAALDVLATLLGAGVLDGIVEVAELHSLALRRLKRSSDERPSLYASWLAEEDALFDLLMRDLELRRKRREG